MHYHYICVYTRYIQSTKKERKKDILEMIIMIMIIRMIIIQTAWLFEYG